MPEDVVRRVWKRRKAREVAFYCRISKDYSPRGFWGFKIADLPFEFNPGEGTQLLGFTYIGLEWPTIEEARKEARRVAKILGGKLLETENPRSAY